MRSKLVVIKKTILDFIRLNRYNCILGRARFLRKSSPFFMITMNQIKKQLIPIFDRIIERPKVKSLFIHFAPDSLRHKAYKRKIWLLGEVSRNPISYYSFKESIALNCIFIHIPKPAGLSVNQALFGNRGTGHINIQEAKLIFGLHAFKKSFKFAFVRNPYDRCVSTFNYLRKGGIDGRVNPKIASHLSDCDSFKEFV